MSSIRIIYFSGTGGTAHGAEVLESVLSERSFSVKRCEIFQRNNPVIDSNEHLILLFPVHAADAPRPIFEWIGTLRKSSNSATVISVSGGGEVTPNTACRYRVIRKLEKKGYRVDREYMLCMPSNFLAPMPEIMANAVISILPAKCRKIAGDIENERILRTPPSLSDKIVTLLCQPEKLGARVFGLMLHASEDCNGCGLCASKCPVGNITMKERIPRFGGNCTLCTRCVYLCPQKAIKAKMMRKAILKEGFDLQDLINKSLAAETRNDKHDDFTTGKLWKGVTDYLLER